MVRIAGLGVALATVAGCMPTLPPGEVGNPRYFGEFLEPLQYIPPLTDRDGNVYVLYGAPDFPTTQVYVGRVNGGWTGGCEASRGLYGLHGFVGRSLTRAWYWSGTALVEVDGSTGACRQVLRNDPISGTELRFLAVAPTIDETPSRRFAYTLVQGATGEPQFAMIDLDRRLPFNALPFPEPDPVVIATGAWTEVRTTLFVVRSADTVTGYYLDRVGDIAREIPITIPQNIGEYDVPAFLEFSDEGVGAGVTTDGRLLVVTRNDGALQDVPFEPEGVLRWDGRLFVTGRENGTAAIAEIGTDGLVGPSEPFLASLAVDQALDRALEVFDERSEPARIRTWEGATTAIGALPFVSPWPVDPYTVDSAGWLIAGPSFTSGAETLTATAFAPIGLEVP